MARLKIRSAPPIISAITVGQVVPATGTLGVTEELGLADGVGVALAGQVQSMSVIHEGLRQAPVVCPEAM